MGALSLGMPGRRLLNNASFVARLKEYLLSTHTFHALDSAGKPCGIVASTDLVDNEFYVVDGDTVVAFTRAIEDFALEDGNGRFLAAFQDSEFFDAGDERYWQLARTLPEVQVIATGPTSKAIDGLSYCEDAKGVLRAFWIVLYQGIRNRVLFVAEQVNNTQNLEDKQFIAFYTFDERVTNETRSDIADLLGGKCPELENFKRLRRLDSAAKQLQVEFERENRNLELAIRRLRRSKKYQLQHFIEDFDKTLQRLTDLKAHLPDLIGGYQRTK
jgi:hypothetical protein